MTLRAIRPIRLVLPKIPLKDDIAKWRPGIQFGTSTYAFLCCRDRRVMHWQRIALDKELESKMFAARYANFRAAAALLFATFLGASAGCEPEAGQAAPKKPALSPQEESFNRIVERIKRRIEHGPGQTYSSAGLDPSLGEMSHFSSVEKVHGELIKPEEEGGTYTAKIIIERDLFFMHTRSGAAEDEPKENAKPESSLPSSLIDDLPDEFPLGEESLLPDDLNLPIDITADAPPTQPAPGKTIAPTPSEKLHDVRRYELAYEGGRWVRKTEVDEESMKLIFEYALEGQ